MKVQNNKLKSFINKYIASFLLLIFLFTQLSNSSVYKVNNFKTQNNIIKNIIKVYNNNTSDNKIINNEASIIPKKNITNNTNESNLLLIKSQKEEVLPDKGCTIRFKDVTLQIPAGAVKEPVIIIIEELNEVNNLNPGMYNITAKVKGYRFKPDGMKFEKKIKITIPFSKEKIENKYELFNTYTYFYNEEKKQWERLERIDLNEEEGLITSLTDHFTDLINSTLKLPENPKPLNFNPNSIKDIKAADPFANIPELQGLEANPFGAAQFSIPLNIPQGRNNLTPQLSIDYNSEGANGWLGVGFDINIPNITIDTKFGVPKYDGNDKLIYNGKNLIHVDNTAEGKIYRSELEENFEKIVRKGNNADNYYFEVTQKDGTKYIYGTDDAKLQSYRTDHKPDYDNPIFIWYLKKVIDTHGNNIIYKYNIINNTADINGRSREIYLSEIVYTGFNDTEGKYSIRFISRNRDDRFIDCRGKFKHKTSRRLEEIEIYFQGSFIRKYIIGYYYNDFGKSQIINITEQYGTNNDFYSYNFNYFEMDKVSGEDDYSFIGFKEPEKWAEGTGLTSIGKSYSISVGGSISFSVGPCGGLDDILGAGGGVSYQKEFSNDLMDLIDMNGDGLPDYLTTNNIMGFFNNNLQVKLNPYGLPSGDKILGSNGNLTGFINATQQDDVMVYANASAVAVGGSAGVTNSRSVAHTTIVDLNGDGLPDFIMSPGATSYFRGNLDYWLSNTGNAFEEVPFTTYVNTSTIDTGVSSDNTMTDMKYSLHLIDPVLKWKPYHRGKIHITGNITKNTTDGDGVKINLYKNNDSVWYNTSNTVSNEIFNFIKYNYYDNTSDPPLSDTAVNAEIYKSLFLKTGTLTHNNTLDIERSDGIYFKVNSMNDIKGDTLDWKPIIYYEEIYLHDLMADYDNVYIPTTITTEFYNTITDKYEKLVIDDCYSNNTLRNNLQETLLNELKEVLGKKGYLVPRKIGYDTFENLTQAHQNLLDDYYKVNNNGTYYILNSTANISAVYNTIKNNNISIPNNELYYTYSYDYNSNTWKYEIIEKTGNNYYVDVEKIKKNISREVTAFNATLENLGVNTDRGVLVDVIDNGNGKIKKWVEKNGAVIRLRIQDQNNNESYNNNIITETINDHIIVRELPDASYDYERVYVLKNDKKILPNPIPPALVNSTLDDFYQTNGYLKVIYEPTDDIVKIGVSNVIAQQTNIIGYDVLVRGIRTYTDHKYDVQFVNQSGTQREDPVIRWSNPNYENSSSLQKSYVMIADFDNTNEQPSEVPYYIHVFNAYEDFEINNLYIVDETPDESQIVETEIPPEYFNGGVYNWHYGEWNGNFLWDLNKIADEIVLGENDTKNFRYFCPMHPLDNNGSSQDVNYWGKDLWHGTTTSYAEKNFDNAGNIITTNIHATSYVSKPPGLLEWCSSKKGAGAEGNVTGTVTSEGIGGLRESVTEAINAGIDAPVLGIGINYNDGCSKSYRDLIDMNGDRYPDQVIFNTAEDSCKIIFNQNGTGFYKDDDIEEFDNCHEDLRKNKNYTYGFGLGKRSSLKKRINALLGRETVYPNQSNYSVSFSASLGQSETHIDLIDINGDGLPDHVKKLNGEDYIVKLNVGDGFENSEWETLDWKDLESAIGSGKSNPDIGSLTGSNGFLRYNNTISAGVNIGSSISYVQLGAGINIYGNRKKVDLIDINGDGLPDQVYKLHSNKYFYVRLNLGYKFSDNLIKWYSTTRSDINDSWKISNSDNFLIDNYIANIISNILTNLTNVNPQDGADTPEENTSSPAKAFGSGLAGIEDYIKNTLGISNLWNDLQPFGAGDVISFEGGVNFTLGFSVKIEIPIIPFILSFYVTPGGNFGYSLGSSQLDLRDVDGDDLPDHIFRYDFENFGRVKYNNAKKVGLLHEITTPTGGLITLDYERTQNTVEMPNSQYVLSEVTHTDIFSNESYTLDYDYADGFYDRVKRSFCGFNTVKQTNPDGSYTSNYYHNDNNYNKGILYLSELYGTDQKLYRETYNNYSFDELYANGLDIVKHKRLDSTKDTYYYYYDGINYRTISKEVVFEDYDIYGNITYAVDKGDNAGDINIYIDYDYNTGKYIVSNPASLIVEDQSGNIIRERRGAYDDKGSLESLTQYLNGSAYATTYLYYDENTANKYGNLTSIRLPKLNNDPAGYAIHYTYDDTVNTYITGITDSFGYTSYAQYNYSLGVETLSRDINGHNFTKIYDNYGRLIEVWTDYDNSNGIPAISFSYNHSSMPASAVTKNKIHFDINQINTATLDTVIFADSLRRVVQTKKEGEIYRNGNTIYGMNVSGATTYDNMGRVKEQGQPLFQELANNIPNYNYWNQAQLKNQTTYYYDPIGRTDYIALPAANNLGSPNTNIIDYQYEIENSQFKTTITDPKNNKKDTYTDVRDNIIKINQYNGSKTITTEYQYNLLGEITGITDTKGNESTMQYDDLGRMTDITNPDMGHIEYIYDVNNNIVEKIDNNLRDESKSIKYNYHYNRLERINYPDKKDVEYIFGGPNAANNGAGRVIQIDDESGRTTFGYGILGEQTEVIKQLNRLKTTQQTRAYSTTYYYDYLGRIDSIIYPDNERLYYEYDNGGNIKSAYGIYLNQQNVRFDYIRMIGYDEFGQRVYIRYGNNVETHYTYDDKRRWLDNISTANSNGFTFQSIDYNFDAIGNILSIHNTGTNKEIVQNFTYDDIYQLTHASGIYTDSSKPTQKINQYEQTFNYDDIGNITNKISINRKTPGNIYPLLLNYNLNYTYSQNYPHRAIQIGTLKYFYDGNGNIVEINNTGENEGLNEADSDNLGIYNNEGDLNMDDNSGNISGSFGWHEGPDSENNNNENASTTFYEWDEDNRLKKAIVRGDTTAYLYDTNGERIVKNSDYGEVIYVNNNYQITGGVNSDVVTKHIFIGDARLVSKVSLGEGPDNINFQRNHIFYYHSDHLGSSNFITDPQGKEYEFLLYTPYGETWVEEGVDYLDYITYKFTGKELDEETGLYYFGARYLDPVTSRWISCDPAFEEYMPAPEQKQKNKDDSVTGFFKLFDNDFPVADVEKYDKLPGQGGIYNLINLALYSYAGNNPVRYIDPDGRDLKYPNQGNADYCGPVDKTWKLTDDGMGAHIIERQNVKNRAALADLDKKETLRFYPYSWKLIDKEDIKYNAGAAHVRLHEEVEAAGMARRGGNPDFSINELLEIYDKGYSSKKLNGIVGELRTPKGQAAPNHKNLTPYQAFEALIEYYNLEKYIKKKK